MGYVCYLIFLSFLCTQREEYGIIMAMNGNENGYGMECMVNFRGGDGG